MMVNVGTIVHCQVPIVSWQRHSEGCDFWSCVFFANYWSLSEFSTGFCFGVLCAVCS